MTKSLFGVSNVTVINGPSVVLSKGSLAYASPQTTKVKPYTLNCSQYPACCGARIVTGFPLNNVGVDRLVAGLEQLIKSHGPGLQYHAILASYQTAFGNKEALETVGFKKVDSFINPNSGNECTTYIYSA